MKRIGEEIEVQTRRNYPYLFRWRGVLYDVRQTYDYWVLQGKWWMNEERRVYFKVFVGGPRYQGTMVLYHARFTETRVERWVLDQVFD